MVKIDPLRQNTSYEVVHELMRLIGLLLHTYHILCSYWFSKHFNHAAKSVKTPQERLSWHVMSFLELKNCFSK